MLSSPQVFIEMIFLKNCLCISPLTSFLNCLLQTHLPYCAQHALQRTASKDISQWNYVDLVVSLAYSFPNSAIANEHPLAGLKQEISLRVQETGSRKSRCWQGQFLLEPQRKGPILCFSPSFQQSVACGHITLISVFIFTHSPLAPPTHHAHSSHWAFALTILTDLHMAHSGLFQAQMSAPQRGCP